LFAAPLFSQIPSAAIAGVLIGTSFRIFNPVNMKAIFKSSNAQISIYLVTALATLAIDLIWGIAIGLILHFFASRLERTSADSR
jgi:SulP family sulfate permease